jgi:DeoR family transcriptional regulator, suf operon transcriptional repressor
VSTSIETSDEGILNLLRRSGAMGVAELARATEVTATAVRQRLVRLMGQGLIEREVVRANRGRPSHRYLLTKKGERQTGSNFADLAMILWQEIRAVPDPQVRRGLYQRLAQKMAGLYQSEIKGDDPAQRMQSVAKVFAERDVPLIVEEKTSGLPVLTALACPYPELAEHDRGICAVERMMFSELLGHDVRLAECRLDGDSCCRFETNN